MLDHPLQKSWYQFAGNFHTYMYAINQLDQSLVSYDIAKKKQLVILDNLGMPRHT